MSRDKIINDLSDSHVTRLQKSLQELENLVITEAAKINPKRGTLKARTTVALAIRPKLKQFIEQTYLTTVQSNITEYDEAAKALVTQLSKFPIPE